MEQARNRDRSRIRLAGSELEAGRKIEEGPEPKSEDRVGRADQCAARQRAVLAMGQTGI